MAYVPFVVGDVYLSSDQPHAGVELDRGVHLLVPRAAEGRSLVAEKRRVVGAEMCD